MQIPVRLPPPGAGRVDVAGLGENSLDLVATLDAFPRPDSKMPMEGFARLPGGQVATAMAATARLGWVSRYVGRVGDDEGLCALGRRREVQRVRTEGHIPQWEYLATDWRG